MKSEIIYSMNVLYKDKFSKSKVENLKADIYWLYAIFLNLNLNI